MAATSHIVKQLGKGTIVATAIGTADALVTNLTGYDTMVDYILLYNQHSAALDVYIAIVNDNAGSAGTPAATDIFYKKSLPAYSSVMIGRNDICIALNDTGDTLNAYAGTTALVNYAVYGAKITDQT